jgi:predicted extracellular nuclease
VLVSRVRLALGLALLAALAGVLAAARPAQAISPSIVISQVYGGGGNTGATLKQDFIELFNRGTTPIDVTGWSVQYASSTGSTWQKTTLTGTIPPGGYYLVGEAFGAGGTVDLPPPDTTGSIAMSATAGKVHLRTNDVLIASGTVCPTDSFDLIGYGSATNCFETAPAPGLSNTTAALRGQDGCQETDTNSTDFTAGAPNPRNSAAVPHVCPTDAAPFVAATDPPNGASDVPRGSNVSITFSEPVNVTGSWFTIACADSGAHPATVSGGPTTYVLDPDTDFSLGEQCTVTVVAANVGDLDIDDPPDTMGADHVFSFTAAGVFARIHEIQGATHLSALNGVALSGVPGVVTARAPNGFYMQDAEPDASDSTSEGIFVFTGSAPPAGAAVGTAVLVSGRVSEFRAGCTPSCDPGSSAFDNLTITEIVNASVTVGGPGAAIPVTIIGTGGRVPPATVIEDDASGNVETSNTFDPAQDGIDFYESLEGMRVGLDDAVVTGPTNDFGEIPVIGDGGANAGVRTIRRGVVVSPSDFNPERVILDDVIVSGEPEVDVNDRFATVRGVMDYNFGNYKLQVTQPLVEIDGGLQREATVPQGADQLAVGSFNVENLSPNDPPAKFAELAGLIVDNLRAPDVLGVQEVQDNNGTAGGLGSPVTDASQTYALLISAIEAAGGPTYEFRQVDPVAHQDGGAPGGNIRVGVLFRPDRVGFVDRPGGTPTTPNAVDGRGGGAHLRYNPGRIDPLNPAFNASRKPLAVEFQFNDKPVFVIVNHFNSKGGDDPLFGRFQPPVRVTETQRHQQAAIVNDFVERITAANKHALVLVLGDLNDFEFSETLDILEGDDLVNLMEGLPKAQRYSYVFEGNSQVLDQMLVSPRLQEKGRPEYDVVHVNSEFAEQASDHDPQVVRLTIAID